MHRNRSAITIMEVMIAVSISSFVAGIGFTGINAFAKSITRAKQFASETELITGLIRQAAFQGDNGRTAITETPGAELKCPKNWTRCVPDVNSAKFYLELKVTNGAGVNTTAQTSGDVRKALQMTSDGSGDYNTLQLKTIACFPP